MIIAAALAQISLRQARLPPLLLLDEPTAALDLAYQLEIAALLRDLRDRLHLSMVLSTHDLNFAASALLVAGPAAGRAGARGRTDRRGPDDTRVRELYGVDAEVHRHAAAGHLVVTPIRRPLASAGR